MLDLVITVFIWGLSFALAKRALNQFSPFELVFIRLTLGALTVFLITRFVRGESADRSPLMGSSAWLAPLVLGIFEFAGTYILYTWSLSYLPSGLVATLTLLTPTMTFLVGIIWKTDSFAWRGIFAAVLSFFGAALCLPLKAFMTISNGASPSTTVLFGVGLLLMSNLFFAIGNVFITARGNPRDQRSTATGLMCGAAIALLVALVTARSPADHFSHFSDWILPLYLGIIATGFGFFLWNRGVSKTSAFPASLVGNFKAPLAVFWGVVLLHESFDLKFFLGLFLLLISTWMIPVHRHRSV